MNDLKAIANLMKQATDQILHPKYKTLKNLTHFRSRVGSGESTYVRHHKTKTGQEYVLTYGIKMLESKQSKKKALQWTTGREITTRQYFNANPSFQNVIVATILHEYAHVIQVQEGGRKARSVHNDHFYKILDGFYAKNYHLELDLYLSSFDAYQKAHYLNEHTSFTKVDLQGAQYVKINSSRRGEYIARIIKLNPKRVLVELDTEERLTVPYVLIEAIYQSKKDVH